MGAVIGLTTVFCVFFIRDLQLLTAGPVHRIGARLAAYGSLGLTYVAVLGYTTPASGSHPLLFFRRPPLWIAAVLVHLILWAVCIWLIKSNRIGAEWLTTLFPAPVFLISIVTFGASLRSLLPGWNSWYYSVSIMSLWCALMASAALLICRSPGRRSDAEFALEFAGFTNVIVLLVVPLHKLVPDSLFSQ